MNVRALGLLVVLAGCSAPEAPPASGPHLFVIVDPGMLDRYDLTMESIVGGLRKAGMDPYSREGLRFSLRAVAFDDVPHVVVGRHQGVPVKLRDVALIEIKP